ncbi:MAG: MazG nucleotide pyrophosphohydrolase domain-containing protein [Clostridia bacterium]|nr:MazG nucleotide pyrophosphohydrolase domain-containing protein [Clostridia bacterium]
MQNKQELLLSKLNNTSSLQEIQNYIQNVIHMRGFGDQSIEQTMLLLTEEIGELAKAIRKDATSMSSDKAKIYNYDTVESELADVFIVLLSVSNTLNIDLFHALREKEKININRKWTK